MRKKPEPYLIDHYPGGDPVEAPVPLTLHDLVLAVMLVIAIVAATIQ